MFTNILDYKVFNKDMKQLIGHIEKFSKVNIISGNPEILYTGIKDKFLHNIYTSTNSVIIPDGIGTVLTSKFLKNPVEQKIAGIEVMEEIIKKCEKENKGIYLVGAKQEILDRCILNLKDKYPQLKIEGSHNGYFDLNNCTELVENIKDKRPYALFVAMGCPRQETFIHNNFETLPCTIFMGVGGSFDVFAGKINRAPKWMINLGLEWLYRVVKEPFRIKRLAIIPKFLIYVMLHKGQKAD